MFFRSALDILETCTCESLQLKTIKLVPRSTRMQSKPDLRLSNLQETNDLFLIRIMVGSWLVFNIAA